MGAPTFSHAQRILTCERCGAPLSAAVEGGRFSCEFCQAVNVLPARDESVDLAAAAAESVTSEAERYARLREQDRALALPPALQSYVNGGTIIDSRVDDAFDAWKSTRARLAEDAASFPIMERLYYLTVLLAPRLDDHNRRAMLETAVEILGDSGHRHVVRCLLAREAARTGDLEAADAWLAPCNKRPTDLQMDSAYRLAAATAATASGDFKQVRAVLGDRFGDVPIYDAFEWECAVLRVNAREQLGEVEDAAAEVERWLGRYPPDAMRAFVAQHAPLTLLVRALPEAVRRHTKERAAETSAEIAARQMQIDQLEVGRVREGLKAGIAFVVFIGIPLTAGLVLPLAVLGIVELRWPEVPTLLIAALVGLAFCGLVFRWAFRRESQTRLTRIAELNKEIADLQRRSG